METVNQEKRQAHWEIVIAVGMLIFSVIGVNIPLYLHSQTQISAIHEEIKDFHEKLIRAEERK